MWGLTTQLWTIREQLFGFEEAGEKSACSPCFLGSMEEAFNLWIQLHPKAKSPIFIMIVQPNERNFYDQIIAVRGLEAKGIKTLRLTLSDIGTFGFLNSDGYLMYQG